MASSRTNEDSRTDAGVKTPARVSVDPEVMGGAPCFIGTRVPASLVLGRFDGGESWGQPVSDYPFLTEAHIRAARAFAAGPEESMPAGAAPAGAGNFAHAAAFTASHRSNLVSGGPVMKARRHVRGPRHETREGEDTALGGNEAQGRG